MTYLDPLSAAPVTTGQLGRRPVPTWDLVLAIVLYLLAAVAGMFAASITPFFAMATDPCGYQSGCREELAMWGIFVSWGGTAVALGGGLAMMIVAAVKRWQMWIWPGLALLLIPLTFAVGLTLAGQVVP